MSTSLRLTGAAVSLCGALVMGVVACKEGSGVLPSAPGPVSAAQQGIQAGRDTGTDALALVASELGQKMILMHFDAIQRYREAGTLSEAELERWWGLAMQSIRLSAQDDFGGSGPGLSGSALGGPTETPLGAQDPRCEARCDKRAPRRLTHSAQRLAQCWRTDGGGECERDFERRNERCHGN